MAAEETVSSEKEKVDGMFREKTQGYRKFC